MEQQSFVNRKGPTLDKGDKKRALMLFRNILSPPSSPLLFFLFAVKPLLRVWLYDSETDLSSIAEEKKMVLWSKIQSSKIYDYWRSFGSSMYSMLLQCLQTSEISCLSLYVHRSILVCLNVFTVKRIV
jgi:hypothetical protein